MLCAANSRPISTNARLGARTVPRSLVERDEPERRRALHHRRSTSPLGNSAAKSAIESSAGSPSVVSSARRR
jgi:hypothetical protein